MEQIRRHFEKTVALTDDDWKIFSSKLIKQDFLKKTLLLKSGQTENCLSFIKKGVVRFFIPKEENDLTFNFAFDNSFVSAYDSFLTQSPSGYHVETLTETVLWRVTYKDLQDIYSETKIGNTIGRVGLVYFTGLLEMAAAIGLCIPRFSVITGGQCLIVFFILLLPANVYEGIKHVDLQSATDNGNGPAYLWFRIPLQLFFIAWTYLSSRKQGKRAPIQL